MKYKSRLIIYSIFIVISLLTFSGIIVTNGIYRYMFSNNLSSAAMIAEDTNVFINQSVGTAQSKDQTPVLYSSSAEYYAQRIASLYSVEVILYDTSFNVVGTNFANAEIIEYKAFASKVMETGKTSYILTEIDGTDHIILFSNLRTTDSVYGVCAIIKSMASAASLIEQVSEMYIYVGIVAVLFCAVIFSAVYKKMLRPITELTQYNKKIISSDVLTPPEVEYEYDDEIYQLISSSYNMANIIGEKNHALLMQNEKLEAVIATMEDAIIMLDSSGREILSNKKASALLQGRKYNEFIPRMDEILEEVFSKQKNVREEFVSDGRNYVFTVVPAPSEDGLQAVIAISDITAVKTFEAEQSKFISSVSHELKTPLTTIIGYIDLLRRRGTDDKNLTQKALDVTVSESKRLLRLVNDILNINTYSRLDFDFIFTDVDMNELLSEAVTEMNVKAEEERKYIVYNSIDLPMINGDYDRLKQVILNILDNALKYSHEEDVIKVTAAYFEETLEVTIRDYGEGIPENMQSKVFDAFYRVGDDRSRMTGGFGLGLSIVKHIIQKHNGEVEIESVPGQGTLVTVILPIKEGEYVYTTDEEEYDEAIDE
ncbi:MAG: GHKL domain-containing protein [Eubacteriaceae bacterium]|nr:GHKL domain-containing protein [Eubacteriaceae bacterium]